MKPLLRGEPRHRCVPAPFAGTQRASGVGGTRPPRLSPGKRDRGSSDFLAAGSSRWCGADGRRAGGICARSSSTFLSITITKLIGRSARSTLSQKSCWLHPLLCRASIRTLNGPHWARCKLGSDLKPRSITTVTDLDCWVLPSGRRSLKDRVVVRSHPNKAVDVLANKTSRGLLASARSTHVGSASSSGFPNCGCLELALPGWSASGPWPATLLPLSARPGVAAHILLR